MARLALGAAYKTQNRKENSIAQYAYAYSLQQGIVDYEAVRVEQHKVGFSDKEKIGTDNIQQCVAVILHDPLTKKTALAHVDRFTDAGSLTHDVISNFPPNTQLEAYLVGGRDRSAVSISVSDGNIRKVTQELTNHFNVNIKSADIEDKGAPLGIIFDPITGNCSG
ncbi:MAG: hypothetical protein AB8U78_01190 [Rickettsia slovaca]|uniref:Uncharacterized protein n=2 Tax=Rickettsia slovaca TaxID=35794 RepID=H8LLL0_RICSL|nr:hypothetical protein [Rickettsia slovaca]AEV91808.1 hypothetical protein Rsl_163 [Rickettsia slovaca 13-B]AFD19145.1 hypothetical protein MC3_00785 [Rickettsia slovaca str. D-CWPP]